MNPRAMLIRAFLAQNSAVGLAYGGFGVTILPMEQRFDVGRGTISLGLSLVVLMTGLVAPNVAGLAKRWGLRAVMISGALLCSAGYAALSFANGVWAALAAYLLLIGPGVGLSGTLPSTMLAVGWYPHARGRAMGLVTMPVVLAITPLAGVTLISHFGLPSFFLVLAALHLASVPILAGIREAMLPQASPSHARLHTTSRGIVARPLFWLVMIGGGLLNATAIIGSVHMVAVGIERGLTPTQAGLLVSFMGAASIGGAILFGWLGDRLGGALTLAVIAAGFAASWAVIGMTGGLGLMVPAILVIGAVGPGVFTGISLLCNHMFGPASMARAVGLFSMFSVPFTFVLPPAAGWIHDQAGSYRPVMAALVLGGVLVAMLFWAIGRREPHTGSVLAG
jgi:Cyanate permease